MTIIDELVNFEEKKRFGFINYNDDGSGAYIVYYRTGKLKANILFNSTGAILEMNRYNEDGSNYPDFITQNRIWMYLKNKNVTYIDGWVWDKMVKMYYIYKEMDEERKQNNNE